MKNGETDMSCTEIYGFDKDGNAYCQTEVKNAWRGAMAIWNALGERYLPLGKSIFNNERMRQIWSLYDSSNISNTDKICLGTTFDKVLIKREDIPDVVEAFRDFDGDTSLKEQADILEEMFKDGDCIAVGWNQTSVTCENWENFGGYDEEKDESIPYNCLTGTEHWYLFDDFETA